MTSRENSCAKNPSPTLHNSLHKYCIIPVFSELKPIPKAILKYLHTYPATQASNIVRNLKSKFPEKSPRTINYHIKKLKNWNLLEELTVLKPFPLQLTLAGRNCVQLGSAGVTDARWVRLERVCVDFDIIEWYAGNLEEFQANFLLPGKWGKVVNVTNNNWLKVIVKSRFSFNRGDTLEFRFGNYPKFSVYLPGVVSRNSKEADDNARDMARYLELRFQEVFAKLGLEIVNKKIKIGSENGGGDAEFEAPAAVDVANKVTIKNGEYWFDRSKGYPEMGVRTVQQAERQFGVPDQIDRVMENQDDLKDYLYSLEKRMFELQTNYSDDQRISILRKDFEIFKSEFKSSQDKIINLLQLIMEEKKA